MRVKIKTISVEIKEDEALSIINALQKGLDNRHLFGSEDERREHAAAARLLDFLNGNFRESHSGIHHPRGL